MANAVAVPETHQPMGITTIVVRGTRWTGRRGSCAAQTASRPAPPRCTIDAEAALDEREVLGAG